MGHRPKYKTKTIKFLEDSIGGNLDNLEFGNDFFFFFNLFLAALGLCCCAQAFSLVAAKGGYSSLQRAGFSLRWLVLLQSTGSRRMGFGSCGMQAQ